MGFFGNKKDKEDDPLGVDAADKDSGLDLPSDHGSNPSDDPFSAPPPGAAPPGQPGMPSGEQHRLDYTNPDLNAATGMPKPRERHDEQPMTAAPQQQPGSGVEKDLQVIIAKLDGLKSEMDSLHQRVQRIERIAVADEEKSQKQRLYGRW
ncbi:hypothetical protein GF367_04195 [Candidatus Woesearchaeota archaeon]|nr:hypothetical protein [Candidatus Woesearchaeota archaeon]